MFWPSAFALAIFLTNSATPAQIPSPRTESLRVVAAYWGEGQSNYDSAAERELLALANRLRKQANLPPLEMDEGLVRAAREHAIAMATRGQLSHQFSGEPDLAERLADNCTLYLVEAAENVAVAESVDRAHDGLVRSPHHRDNLLHPSYNVVGFGIVRRGAQLYVVQDFGNSLPTYSQKRTEEMIAGSIEQKRADAALPRLKQRDDGASASEACAMAQGDSLKSAAYNQALQGRHILRYTSLQPDSLPAAATQIIKDSSITAYSTHSCFARSKSYPNGVYWVVLVFY